MLTRCPGHAPHASTTILLFLVILKNVLKNAKNFLEKSKKSTEKRELCVVMDVFHRSEYSNLENNSDAASDESRTPVRSKHHYV